MKPLTNSRLDNLPTPLSAFIGREQEITEVKKLLSANRLFTLSGPGGCGKTRLALKVAQELLGDFEDGIWFIDLASLYEPALVPQTVASTLGVYEQSGRTFLEVLSDYLLSRRVLLVFDNCEHLISPCARLAEGILQKCTDVKILATSREALGITGEFIWLVPPLSLPDLQPWANPGQAVEAVQTYEKSESVQLFVARAQAISSGFGLTSENGGWVANICRHLDGMPLAIELAAARVRSLSVQQIAQRLDDRFHLLTGGSRTAPHRQQTLAATLDWSYALLSVKEQKVLQRLSVFAGGATLTAAESICAGEGVESAEALDTLSHLVDKNLVTVDRPERGEPRYRLLETIREYARARLLESGEQERIHSQHLDYFLQVAEEAEPKLEGSDQAAWISRLQLEPDNLRAALAWSLENNPGAALRLAGALGQFWLMRGHHFGEGKEWLEKAISRTKTSEQEALRAKAFNWLGTLAFYHGDYARARSAYEDSLRLYQSVHDTYGVAESSYFLADAAAMQGDAAARNLFAAARSYFESNLASLREKGDEWKLARMLNSLGEIARIEGDYSAARSYYDESLILRRELGDQRGMAVSLINLGYVAHHQGDYQNAAESFEESLARFQQLESTRGIIDCLAALAGVAGAKKQPERATRLFGAAQALHETIHAGLAAAYPDRVEYDRSMAAVRSQLTDDAFSTFWAEGRTMTLEQAVDYALSDQDMAVSDTSFKEKFGNLTPREREAAALIAQGKSNREIAEAMIVSVRTVETYVTRILNKLGFDSRVQIATWAVEKGLSSSIKDG